MSKIATKGLDERRCLCQARALQMTTPLTDWKVTEQAALDAGAVWHVARPARPAQTGEEKVPTVKPNPEPKEAPHENHH